MLVNKDDGSESTDEQDSRESKRQVDSIGKSQSTCDRTPDAPEVDDEVPSNRGDRSLLEHWFRLWKTEPKRYALQAGDRPVRQGELLSMLYTTCIVWQRVTR